VPRFDFGLSDLETTESRQQLGTLYAQAYAFDEASAQPVGSQGAAFEHVRVAIEPQRCTELLGGHGVLEVALVEVVDHRDRRQVGSTEPGLELFVAASIPFGLAGLRVDHEDHYVRVLDQSPSPRDQRYLARYRGELTGHLRAAEQPSFVFGPVEVESAAAGSGRREDSLPAASPAKCRHQRIQRFGLAGERRAGVDDPNVE
jgi:hypothetical protein